MHAGHKEFEIQRTTIPRELRIRMQYEYSPSSAAAGLERCGNRQKRELATPSSKSPASSISVIRTITRAYMRERIDVTRCFQPIPIFLRYLFSDCSSTQQQDHGDSTKPTHHVIVWTWSPLHSLADRVRHCKGLYPRENPNSFHSSLQRHGTAGGKEEETGGGLSLVFRVCNGAS